MIQVHRCSPGGRFSARCHAQSDGRQGRKLYFLQPPREGSQGPMLKHSDSSWATADDGRHLVRAEAGKDTKEDHLGLDLGQHANDTNRSSEVGGVHGQLFGT